MPVVTRDATSLIWYPATAAEVTSLYSGRGISAPVHGYNCQDAAGNLVDFIGSVPLVKFNAPSYLTAFPGHTRKAIGYQANNDCHFVSPVAAGDVGDISNVSSSILMFSAAANGLGSAPPTSTKNMINFGASPNDRHYQWSAASKFAIAGTGQATGNGSATPGNGAHGIIFEVNRTGSAFVLQDDQETIAPTYTAPAGGSAYLSIGPDAVGDAGQTVTLVTFMLMWAGSAAEFTAAQRASILDCHYNGPAVTGVAITPTPVTLTSLGSTQQMTATATRADTTTFDCTNGTNVPSTATAVWTSDAPSIATVSATGLVTAVSAGTAHITRTFTSLNASAAVSNSVTVTVSGAATLTSITLAGSSTLGVGYSTQYTATGHYSDSSTADITNSAVWTSSAPIVASVTAGLVTGLSIGSTTITATVSAINASVVITTNGLAQTLVDHVTSTLPRWLWKGKTAALEWLYAYRDIFDAARSQGQTWLDLTFLDSATGSALDQHAKDRGTSRRLNEDDDTLRARLKNITDTVTEPALKISVDNILSAAGYGPSFWVVLRRDAAHLSRHDAFLSRGCRMGTKFFPGVDGLTGVAGSPMIYIVILPTGTPTAVQNAISEYLRQYGPAGFAYLLEISP